jgi:excinuclease ABC subunit C
MTPGIEEQLERLPDHTGVYIFRDAEGKSIYIGKALSLRSRVRSHFHAGRSLNARSINMYNRVATIDYITTGSEVESLILESNLVKEHLPEYNIRLKDDKHFPYLRVDPSQTYPKVEITRRLRRDGARYFGPYTRPGSLRETLRLLRRVFPYRTCTDYKLRTVKRPCLDYHIRRCAGPCAGAVTAEDYRAMMEELQLFLEGRRTQLARRLKARMEEASADLKFERAAELRDQLRAVEDVMEKQAIISPTMQDQDVIAYAESASGPGEGDSETGVKAAGGIVAVTVLQVREGKLIDRTWFVLEEAAGQPGLEIISAFLKQRYGQGLIFIPDRILIPEILPKDERVPIEGWLSALKGKRVTLECPLRGPEGHLIELAAQNARVVLRDEEHRRASGSEAAYARAVALGELLGLEAVPERIEAYDVSNIQGREAVGAMAVFLGGRPAPAAYRRFRIRGPGRPDDYAMLQEVLFRRFRRLREGDPGPEAPPPGESLDRLGPAPDVVLIDGGKGHLAVALEVLEDLGLRLPVLALAKEEEEVFLPGRSTPLDVHPHSPAVRLLRHVRDEAHRFAVGYHRLLRRKVARHSELDGIAGIGPVRRTALLRAFGSTEKIRTASLDELTAVPEIGPAAAAKVWEHFRADDRAPGASGGPSAGLSDEPDPAPRKGS